MNAVLLMPALLSVGLWHQNLRLQNSGGDDGHGQGDLVVSWGGITGTIHRRAAGKTMGMISAAESLSRRLVVALRRRGARSGHVKSFE